MKPNKIMIVITALLLFTLACLCTGTSSIPTAVPQVPTISIPPTESQPATSGIITGIIMAKDTQGDLMDPVDPTTVFSPSSVIHAVVQIENAPANTQFTAAFYVVDVGDAADPNSLITSTDLTADGTRNLDFSLSPQTEWPVGSYRVDISVNGNVEDSADYTVQ
jgi:hypothetical protein